MEARAASGPRSGHNLHALTLAKTRGKTPRKRAGSDSSHVAISGLFWLARGEIYSIAGESRNERDAPHRSKSQSGAGSSRKAAARAIVIHPVTFPDACNASAGSFLISSRATSVSWAHRSRLGSAGARPGLRVLSPVAVTRRPAHDPRPWQAGFVGGKPAPLASCGPRSNPGTAPL